jgi:hypothetical protein
VRVTQSFRAYATQPSAPSASSACVNWHFGQGLLVTIIVIQQRLHRPLKCLSIKTADATDGADANNNLPIHSKCAVVHLGCFGKYEGKKRIEPRPNIPTLV